MRRCIIGGYDVDIMEDDEGDWVEWEDVEGLIADWQLMRVAMQGLVDMGDKGLMMKTKTYKQFKGVLENLKVVD